MMLKILNKYNLTYGHFRNHFLNKENSFIEVTESGGFTERYNSSKIDGKIPFDSFIALRKYGKRVMDMIVLGQTTKVIKT